LQRRGKRIKREVNQYESIIDSNRIVFCSSSTQLASEAALDRQVAAYVACDIRGAVDHSRCPMIKKMHKSVAPYVLTPEKDEMHFRMIEMIEKKEETK
jgi:hypothetical protein